MTKRDDRNLSTPAASDSLVHFLFLISFSSGRALVAYHADVYSLAYTFAPFLLFVFDAGSHKAIIRWKGKHKCCFFLFKIMIIQDPFLGWVYFCLLDYFSSISEWLLFDAVVPGTWWFIATPTLCCWAIVLWWLLRLIGPRTFVGSAVIEHPIDIKLQVYKLYIYSFLNTHTEISASRPGL